MKFKLEITSEELGKTLEINGENLTINTISKNVVRSPAQPKAIIAETPIKRTAVTAKKNKPQQKKGGWPKGMPRKNKIKEALSQVVADKPTLIEGETHD